MDEEGRETTGISSLLTSELPQTFYNISGNTGMCEDDISAVVFVPVHIQNTNAHT